MSVTKEHQSTMTPLEYLKATNHPDLRTAEGYMESHKNMGTDVNKRIYAGIQAGHYKMTHPPSMLGKDIYIGFSGKIQAGNMREMLSTPYGQSTHFTAKMFGGKKTRRRRHNKKQKKSKMSKKSKKSRKTRKTRRRRH
tara:strand:+ start:469 stop:882 length:414 start_codon:yes stop_codon:yes gene_type:complete